MVTAERITSLKGRVSEIEYDDLLYLVQSGWPENLYWEFKSRGPHPPLDRLEQTEKTSLGEILSGFANSDGGIVIYGIRSRRDGVVDRAADLQPIKDIDRFADLIVTSADGLVSPLIPQIQYAKIRVPGQFDDGFFCVQVPRSERRPHMSLASGHHKYFYRRSDGFHPMAHFQIEDAFSRRLTPEIEPFVLNGADWNITNERSGEAGAFAISASRTIGVGATNVSNISAEHVSLDVWCESGTRRPNIQASSGYAFVHYSDKSAFLTPVGTTIVNPGQSLPIFNFSINIRRDDENSRWEWNGPFGPFDPEEGLALDLRYGAKNTPVQEHKIYISIESELEGLARVLAERYLVVAQPSPG